ncbi:4Fe-4S dicluster domain-containing protein [Candidatus Sumerlaeota bacterium]|nr:4Fe-4S dicluster domain-containing protein [Candidatus Sumerlaeota bacterium]
MPIRVNPKLVNEIERYGAEDVSKCYHCGNCSAVCPHSTQPFVFPRAPMRLLQMGFESKLQNSLEPWLCYYCGQCSEQCPRDAEPGETMMSLRRWLISRYDFTGLSRLFYRSWKAELGALLIMAVLTGVGFLLWGFTHGDIRSYDGPNAFLASSAVHIFDWTMAVVLTLFLTANCVRMWWFTVAGRKDISVPLLSYLRGVYLIPLHFFTQKRYAECGHKTSWAVHMVLMASYVTMFVLIMFFLHAVQAGPEINWNVHIFGYLATAGLIGACIVMLRARVKKDHVWSERSHASDWMFLVLLLYVSVTGILQHILHRSGLGMAANITYVCHMMGVVPMLLIEVPFSKWAHMAYRPLAMFFADLTAEALLAKEKKPSGLSSPQLAEIG